MPPPETGWGLWDVNMFLGYLVVFCCYGCWTPVVVLVLARYASLKGEANVVIVVWGRSRGLSEFTSKISLQCFNSYGPCSLYQYQAVASL